jgi:hypothetical protein
MRFWLDTDHISTLQMQSGPEYLAIMLRLAQVPRADVTICIVSGSAVLQSSGQADQFAAPLDAFAGVSPGISRSALP